MGEVENRKVKALFELLFNLFLAGIQVDMAIGAGNDDRGKAFFNDPRDIVSERIESLPDGIGKESLGQIQCGLHPGNASPYDHD